MVSVSKVEIEKIDGGMSIIIDGVKLNADMLSELNVKVSDGGDIEFDCKSVPYGEKVMEILSLPHTKNGRKLPDISIPFTIDALESQHYYTSIYEEWKSTIE